MFVANVTKTFMPETQRPNCIKSSGEPCDAKVSRTVRRGAVGKVPGRQLASSLPYHSDHVESFSVHDGQNYWKCFACEKSGSIIDFWIYYRDCDFRTAVTQLANMLL